MAFTDYNFRGNETFDNLANEFGTSVAEIMKLNNINPPYVRDIQSLPQSVKDELNGTLKIPCISTGNNSFEGFSQLSYKTIGAEYKNYSEFINASKSTINYGRPLVRFGSGAVVPGSCKKDCWISVDGSKLNFPCYPESVSDSNTASYHAQTILGRSEPIQIYQNSGPRSVSVSFEMHCEMVHGANSNAADYNYVYRLTSLIESACYPNYGSSVAAPKVTLSVAKTIKITGIITSVSTVWKTPIIDNKYQMVDISFSVTECTGSPKSRSEINGMGGYR